MPQSTPSNQHQPRTSSTALTVLGVVLLLVSNVLPLFLLGMVVVPGSAGNDFGAGGMAMFAVVVLFVLVSPLTAAVGLFLAHRYCRNSFVCLFAWVATLPTLIGLACVTFCFVRVMLT